MKYVHPDVLDNGIAHLRANATRALLLPSFAADTTYAQAVSSALVSAAISSTDFTLSTAGTGRQVVFTGAIATATASAAQGSPLHVALIDGAGRILLVNDEASRIAIVAGERYKIPAVTCVNPQPQ